jgi:hypothetical protein
MLVIVSQSGCVVELQQLTVKSAACRVNVNTCEVLAVALHSSEFGGILGVCTTGFVCLSRVCPGSPRCLFTGYPVPVRVVCWWWVWLVVRLVCVPLCFRVSRVSRVCPGSPRCLFTVPGRRDCVLWNDRRDFIRPARVCALYGTLCRQ